MSASPVLVVGRCECFLIADKLYIIYLVLICVNASSMKRKFRCYLLIFLFMFVLIGFELFQQMRYNLLSTYFLTINFIYYNILIKSKITGHYNNASRNLYSKKVKPQYE